MKKRILSLITATLLCLSVSSCGEKEDETTLPETTESTEPTASSLIFVDGEDGNDEWDGTTPETAVASYEGAFALLSAERNRIVIVRSVMSESSYELPQYDGAVTITAKNADTDYGELNNASFRVGYTLSVNSDITFENIEIKPIGKGTNLCLNFHNATFGEGVVLEHTNTRSINLVLGYEVKDKALNATGHQTAKEVSAKRDCTLTVNSGNWNSIIGGNFRAGYNSPVGTYNGNLTINIGGTATVNSGAPADDIEGLGVSATGHNISKGTVTLNISGGTFNCPVYAVGKVGRYYNNTTDNGKKGTDGTQYGNDVKYEATVTVNVTGGDFTSKSASVIRGLQVPGDTAMHGDYTLNVTGGSFKDDFVFDGFGFIGKSKAYGIDKSKAVAFDEIDSSATGYKEPLRIACCGDSITFGTCAAATVIDGYSYAKENFFYPTVMQKLYGTDAVVGNFGYPGSYVGTSHNKYLNSSVYTSLIEFDPDVIVLALGTNNASLMPSSKDSFISNYRTMLMDMHKRFPDAKIIMTTAIYRFDKVERIQQLDEYIIPIQKQMADAFDYVYLYDAYTEYRPYGNTTYYKDKLHPNNLGYEKLAEVMKKGVDTLLAAQ